jgi:hypothetical protein
VITPTITYDIPNKPDKFPQQAKKLDGKSHSTTQNRMTIKKGSNKSAIHEVNQGIGDSSEPPLSVSTVTPTPSHNTQGKQGDQCSSFKPTQAEHVAAKAGQSQAIDALGIQTFENVAPDKPDQCHTNNTTPIH